MLLVVVALVASVAAALASTASAALPCTVCEYVVGYVEGYVKMNPDATLMEIETYVKTKVCAHLGSFAEECNLVVDAEIPAIVEALKNMPPADVCANVHLCSSSAALQQAVADAAAANKIAKLPAKLPCELCTFVVGAAAAYVRDHEDATADKVSAELNKVCDALGGTVSGPCRDMVAQHVPAVLDALTRVAPDEVCGELRLCSATAALTVEHDDVEPDSAVGCTACTFIVDEVDDMLKKNKTQAQIEAEADRLCDATGPFAEECKEWFHMEIPNIIMYLTHMSPSKVCQQLHACATAVAPAVTLAPKLAAASSVPCPACEFVVKYVDELVARNQDAELEWVEAKANAMCKALPSYSAECKYLVAKELEQVLEWLENDVSPHEVCQKLKMCAATTTPALELVKPAAKFQTKALELVKPAAAAAAAGVDDAPDFSIASVKPLALQCTVCEYVVQYVEDVVNKNPDATIEEVEKLVKDKVCAHLGLLASECDAMVDEELPAIIDALKDSAPAAVCQQVHLCSSS